MQRTIPNYRLYAGDDETLLDQWVHCETIAVRSARHRWHIRTHAHAEFYQVLHVRSGKVIADLDGSTLHPAAPLLVTMPPRVAHGYRFSRSVEGHIVTISADRFERMLAMCDGALALMAEPRVLSLDCDGRDARAAEAMIGAIASEFSITDRWQSQRIEALMLALLVQICRRLADELGTSSSGRPDADAKALAFRAEVDRRFRSHASLKTYARAVGVSETHLNRICRRAFGTSALGLIQRRVMLEASRDLTFTSHPVAEIAEKLGYDDPAYFSRAFRKHTGMSPRAFRAAAAS